MKEYNRLLCFIAFGINLCFYVSIGLAQTQPKIIPPSPEAYALGKYGDIPVATYTGIPQITIPIATISENELKADVYLSYHAGGIKVDEAASWVGLGWALNAGGSITRVVRHRAEYPNSANQMKPDRADIALFTGWSSSQALTYLNTSDHQFVVNGGLDSEPDEFAFNFMGYSGKFHLDSEGKVTLYNHDGMDVTFEYAGSSQSKFIIRGVDGIKYEFAETEYSTYVDAYQSAITTWYLSRIESPKGGTILFEYQGFPAMGIEGREISEHVMEITSTSNNINVLSYPTMVADVMEKKIKKITTSNGTIEFKRNPSRRQDLRYDSYALDEIVITNGNNTINKRFKFQMSYFEANNTRKYTGVNASTFTYLNYRLRLDAIQELNSAGQAVKPPYTISYLGDNNPATDDKYTLPHRLSSSQDHWGYYNQTNNSHIFPGNPQGRPIPMDKTYQIFLPNTGLSINNVMSNGANRSVDTAAAKAGLIKELHYPTGGYTAFTFESNSFSWFTTEYGAGIRVKEIANYTGGTVSSKKIYEYQYGHITHHPVDHYYTYFHVYYHTSGGPRIATDILTAFRLPVGHSYTANGRKFVKIRALPQNMLGATSMVTYQSVTVREPGNGRTLYLYDTSSQFPDYTSAESSYDLLDAGKIPQQFYMQFVSSIDPGGFDSPFEFSVSKLEGIGIMDFPYPPIYSNEWKRGVLTNQNIYNEAGHLVTKIEKKYYRQTMKTIPAWKVVAFRNQSEFISVKYFVPQGWIYQNKEIITQYDANGQNPHTTETDFLHGNPSHAQLTKMTKQLSDGTKEITSIAYADDYNDLTGFVGNMKSENLKSYPIEEVTYKEVGTTQTILSGNITTYKTGGKGLVDQALELETSTPLALSSFRFSNRSAVNQLPPIGANANYSPDTRYKVRLTHDAHDAKGNLLQYTTSQGPPVSYLWGYNYQYPIAEGQNAGQYDIAYVGFEAVEQNLSLINVGTVADASAPTGRRVGTMVGSQSPKITKYGLTGGKSYILTYWVKNNSTMPSFEGGTVTAAELVRTKGAWKCYRHRVSNVSTLAIKITTGSTTIDDIRLHPVDGQLDTYTYDPLVGMTSHTDAAGNVAHYEYDTLGRLLLIRDLEGKVIEDYRYNYSN